MPNRPGDLKTIADLFDRISSADGGTADVAGIWATDRNVLIAEVTAQILLFQQIHKRPVQDGVADPNGGTLRQMNKVAADPPAGAITATVMPAPEGYDEVMGPFGIFVADPPSLYGSGPLTMTVVNSAYVRRLVRVEGCSISWFGVVLPANGDWSRPHINFTPTPNQGGYSDLTYDSFGGWGRLWADYTSVIGGQVAAADPNQLVIIPIYRTRQADDLGNFKAYWRDVITRVASVAIDSVDPYRLRKDYTFDRIVSSSFSNGFRAHKDFNGRGAGVADATDTIFDLDGQAGGSTWRPSNGVIYLNRSGPASGSPVAGLHWYVGGRWTSQFNAAYGGGYSSHAACRNHLLYHGVWLYCT
ncbi:MAG TPA: hypothetical protein VNH46_01360 [Gemmatimonadales bacterium]|nr:hypothetical protein [Gemmatimonadales bacterium]